MFKTVRTGSSSPFYSERGAARGGVATANGWRVWVEHVDSGELQFSLEISLRPRCRIV